jgi:hypothetical protein
VLPAVVVKITAGARAARWWWPGQLGKGYLRPGRGGRSIYPRRARTSATSSRKRDRAPSSKPPAASLPQAH